MPQGVLFTAHTLHGEVQATALTAQVDARTLIGDITISTSGSAQASTLHGSTGAIISDFPLTVTSSREGISTMAGGTLGAGARLLKLSTFNGQ